MALTQGSWEVAGSRCTSGGHEMVPMGWWEKRRGGRGRADLTTIRDEGD